LVYSVLPEKVAIWLVTKDSLNVATSEIKSDNLQEKVTNCLEIVSKKYEPNKHFDLSKELYNILILPIKNKINSNKQLVIIPDKFLFRLPFAALYSDKYHIHQVPTFFLIAQEKPKNLIIKTAKIY
jgi:CHAT domain-containing protein